MTNNEDPTRAQASANTREWMRRSADATTLTLPEALRRRPASMLSGDIGTMLAEIPRDPMAART